jgi:hypothetical protein
MLRYALGAILALCVVALAFAVEVFPPSFKTRTSFDTGEAATRLVVDFLSK